VTDLLVMHDVVDGQLLSSDGRRLGRVSDILCRQVDGSLTAVNLVLGVEAGLRRIASRLGGPADRLFGGRFERSVDLGEVIEFGATLRLRNDASSYRVHDGDRWAARIIRFLPGSGYDAARAAVGSHNRASALASRRGDVWVSDLIGTPVVDSDGRELGHVVELRIGPRHHRVTSILTGSYGWLGRLGLRTLVHRLGWIDRADEVPWDRVQEVGGNIITVRIPSKGSQRTTRRHRPRS
jgi:sporulation protein YlmC with PRC-barrel domain